MMLCNKKLYDKLWKYSIFFQQSEAKGMNYYNFVDQLFKYLVFLITI